MFTLAENAEIGKYLKFQIEEQFESQRQFCREYLTLIGEPADKPQTDKMANRLSQILRGKKEIQLRDLPVFCRLLEISCEDILSAGKNHILASTRLTNYAVAFSQDEHEWEAYVTREDSPVLNADEYGKTVIDYALDAENYDLLKYLMDKKYIWFVGGDEKDYFVNFGAGTSLEKNNFPYPRNLNVLDTHLKMRDELRTYMIALAIRHGDIDMLEQLHAREIPPLYQISRFSNCPEKCHRYYNIKLMEALTQADHKILEYFSGEFEIADRVSSMKNKFLFPFLGELIEKLIQTGNEFAEYMLKDAIRHNQYVYNQLTSLLADTVEYFKRLDYDMTNAAIKNNLEKGIARDLDFYDEGSLVSYFAPFPGTKKGLRSNIIRVGVESSDTMITRRIAELNGLYDAVHCITPKFEGGDDNVL